MITYARAIDAPEAALELAIACLGRLRAFSTHSLAERVPADRVARALLDDLAANASTHSTWLALDESGHARAMLSAMLRIVKPDDAEYTYMPPTYALLPLSGQLFLEEEDFRLAAPLLRRVSDDAAALGIDVMKANARCGDWAAGTLWRSLGMRLDSIMAGRKAWPPIAPRPESRVTIRQGAPEDEAELVRLCFEEYEYHALHTKSGTRRDQDPEPTRRLVRSWLSPSGEDPLPVLVAEDASADGLLGCLSLYRITHPEDSPGRYIYPAEYGYIGLTSVSEDARGKGVGRSLASAGISELQRRGFADIFLHYVDDNVLSRPFWQGLGFAPITETLAVPLEKLLLALPDR